MGQNSLIEIEYNSPGPVADQFYDLTALDAVVQLVRGPVGSAKTTACLVKLIKLAMSQTPNAKGVRPTRFAIVRRSFEDLRRTVYSDWANIWKPLEKYRHLTKQPMHDEISFPLEDGTKIEAEFVFLALDKEDDIERLRGGNFTGFMFNETKQLIMEVLTEAVRRAGRFPSEVLGRVKCDPEIAVVLGDTNAPDDEHWLKEIEDNKPEGWMALVQPPAAWPKETAPIEGEEVRSRGGNIYVLNPDAENGQNLPPGYYRKIIQTSADDKIKADVCNLLTHIQEGKPVYPEYYDNPHCNENVAYDPNLPLLLGGDGGLTPAVIIGQLSKRGQLRILEELVAKDSGVKQFWRDVVKPHLQAKYPGASIGLAWFDPAGNNRGEGEGKSAISILNDAYEGDALNLGFVVEAANTNDPTKRTQAVRDYLIKMIDGQPGFLIHPSCKVLRRGFNGKYAYRKVQVVGPDRYHEKPDKNEYSHPHDALQYLALGAAGGFVTDGDELDYDEWEDDSGRSAVTGY